MSKHLDPSAQRQRWVMDCSHQKLDLVPELQPEPALTMEVVLQLEFGIGMPSEIPVLREQAGCPCPTPYGTTAEAAQEHCADG